jgi:hypothetical protein
MIVVHFQDLFSLVIVKATKPLIDIIGLYFVSMRCEEIGRSQLMLVTHGNKGHKIV